MARLIVDSKRYKATLDSKDYDWFESLSWLVIEHKNRRTKMKIPIAAINYIAILEDEESEKSAKGK
jgi:hypothetical protein